ncbi:MAG: 1-(5-phosphoribosyl)-5-[(5-phosphoribosylamino)methylideneamino]imidazole-4-carboxamide isomerase [Candidatus Omnitrophota bacterium]|nr:MAG: 1-(5-phosphoribosyl)-5-[(5-phosphoribosylamino)methylideneamino]imidazole-4-carboxamide isomerase [Candidatus Omnitrophota bacterium]
MIIIPAIDLYKGGVVRLVKGDISQAKFYNFKPLEAARKWEQAGAKWLHLVDLSAAFGKGDNLDIIKDIIKEVKIKVQVGGGIRSIEKAKKLISYGAERIIIGTRSLDDDFLKDIINCLGPDKVAVGVDVLDSSVAVEGWQRKTTLKGVDFIKYLRDRAVKWVIYTDIARDGTLKGVDISRIKELSQFKDMNFIVSGGVSSLDDLIKIKKEAPFVWGVIIGKALYDNKIDLGEAISLAL